MHLAADGLHVSYGKSKILHGISLDVSGGEVVALLGRNGAGKTTTLRTLVGAVRPTRGVITLDGANVTRAAPHVRARRGLGYVPQERLVFGRLTVEENLRVVAAREASAELEYVLKLFPILRERRRQKAGTLSGGEQQILAIARGLTMRPQLLLLDEPSTGLMPSVAERLEQLIRELSEHGVGVLLVEEKVPLALAVATRAYVVETGEIVFSGGIGELRASGALERHVGVAASEDGTIEDGVNTAT